MRIRKPVAKFGFLALALGVATFGSIALFDVSFGAAVVWGTACIVAAVYVAARSFRGPTEPDTSRPWWKMTSTRWGSIILSGLFLGQGLALFGSFSSAPVPLFAAGSGLVALVIAGFYLNSGIRTDRPTGRISLDAG